jgi:putative glutamine amidotransferase
VSARPLIGVSTSELREAARVTPVAQSEPARRELALGVSYLEAIERAGAIPVILAPLPDERVGPLLDRLQGLCLSGGPDLDPGSYGASAHAQLGPTEPHLDAFELALARRAHARRLPMLAICRGAQLLNVARGGSLHQHVPDVVGEDVCHRAGALHEHPASHPVRIAPSSRLARLMGTTEAEVNSYHHQAVDRLGIGLRAVAWSQDGVIEGVEAQGPAFAVGVQWHAECLLDRPEQRRLFEGFVRAARRGVPLTERQAA